MSATNHTQNYDLSQFVGGDIPSWLGDYNGDMGKIDAAIAAVASGAGDTASEVNSLKSRMTAAEADIDSAESNIATLQSTTSTQGAAITQNANNITTTNNNVSALDTRVTALENASGSGLDLSAYSGAITPAVPSGATLDDSSVHYALNSDKTIGKINGFIRVRDVSVSTDWSTIATLSSADLPTRTAQKTVDLGYCMCYTTGLDVVAIRLALNTDGTINVQGKFTAAETMTIWATLPPVLYLIDQGL